MTYDARQIANWFISRAKQDGRSVSIMQLLKLTYIAHGWHLETQQSPLFENKIEAWQYGPVIPDVYNEFRPQGVMISNVANKIPPANLDPKDEKLLQDIWKIYGKLPASKLSYLTHVPGGPWDAATKIGGNFARIPDDLIRNHYCGLRLRAEAAAAAAGTNV